LMNFKTPVEMQLKRIDAGQTGNLEGYHHKGYIGGADWWYRNPFVPARLADEEIAIATCLGSMARYLETGESFYGLAQGCQDHYLSILIDRAVTSGGPVESRTQIWAEDCEADSLSEEQRPRVSGIRTGKKGPAAKSENSGN